MTSTSILIRDLPFEVKTGLKQLAATHRRSMEEEARQILRAAVARASKRAAAQVSTPPPPPSLGQKIHDRFKALGGVELQVPPRGAWRALPAFADPTP